MGKLLMFPLLSFNSYEYLQRLPLPPPLLLPLPLQSKLPPFMLSLLRVKLQLLDLDLHLNLLELALHRLPPNYLYVAQGCCFYHLSLQLLLYYYIVVLDLMDTKLGQQPYLYPDMELHPDLQQLGLSASRSRSGAGESAATFASSVASVTGSPGGTTASAIFSSGYHYYISRDTLWITHPFPSYYLKSTHVGPLS